jgi:uncharacterized protein
MKGIIIALALTLLGLIVFKIEFKSFGFKPTGKRIQDLAIGFSVAAFTAGLYFYLIIHLLDFKVAVNPDFDLPALFYSIWQVFRSVLIEELIFRGALLILSIQLMGKYRACLLSAILFGVYHWFSYDVFGSFLPMLNTFLTTFVGGLMFAYAYAETRSLYLPVALHFGWNLMTVTVFSEGPLGDQLIISSGGNPMKYLYFPFLIYQILILPILTFLYLKKRRKKTKLEMI